MITFYIVPAWSDQAGQCRIVSREGFEGDAGKSYRADPDKWQEAGKMNSRGELVCLNGSKEAWREFKDCEPLMAGLQITVASGDESLYVSLGEINATK